MMRHFAPVVTLLSCALASIAARSAPPALGAAPPPLKLEGLLQVPEGTDLTSWDSLEGRVVVLEFWGTWCPPCVAAIPHLNELATQFEDQPVTFISVTFEPASVIEPFLARKPMKSWIGLDTDRSVVRDYGVTGWPTTVLIDKAGRLAAVTSPLSVTKTVIENLLAGREPGLWMPDGRERVEDDDDDDDEDEDSEAPPSLVGVRITASRGTTASIWRGPERLEFRGQRLTSIIGSLYDMPATRMVFEADLPGERLDARVTCPGGDEALTTEILRLNLERLFGYEVRRQTVEREVFILTAADERGTGMTPTVLNDGASSAIGGGSLNLLGSDAPGIAGCLELMLQTPVIEETGLEGEWDVLLRAEDETHQAIITAAREQLGLVLTKAKRDIEVGVIAAPE